MSDEAKRPVSEISHLFLSAVRDAVGNGAPRPQRIPPGAPRPAAAPQAGPAVAAPLGGGIDLTPAEFAHVFGPTADPADDADAYEADDDLYDGDGAGSSLDEQDDAAAAGVAPVTAVLAAHLGGRAADRVRDYARQLAAREGRVGLIDLGGAAAADFRLSCFEAAAEPGTETDARPAGGTGPCDARDVAEALEELNVDVDRWLVVLPAARSGDGADAAAALARRCERWALLTTPDHDGVIAAYKAVKGLAGARVAGPGYGTALGVAVLDAAGDAEAARVRQKLAGVCEQFLGWPADAGEPPVRYAAGVAEHVLLAGRVTASAADGPGGTAGGWPHHAAVAALLARPRRGHTVVAASAVVAEPAMATNEMNEPVPIDRMPSDRMPVAEPPAAVAVRRSDSGPAAVPAQVPTGPTLRVVRDDADDRGPAESRPATGPASAAHAAAAPTASVFSVPNFAAPAGFATAAVAAVAPAPAGPARWAVPSAPAAPAMLIAPAFPPAAAAPSFGTAPAAAGDEVIDLPGDASDAAGILAAVLRRAEFGLAECPVGVPNCPAGRLAVARDRGLVLVAAATRGLPELRSIARANQWLHENRGLVAMAVPQFAIDPARPPAVVLLVDQADVSADLLGPMLRDGQVAVRAYRTLRWGGRTGLLLDAA